MNKQLHRLKDELIFPSDNEFGIPLLLPQTFDLPSGIRLIRYRGTSSDDQRRAAICHFYLYDFMFESVWYNPLKSMSHVRRYWGVFTPDFSLYREFPMAMQLWNTYRSRWMGRFWQHHGVHVIPTVNWSDHASYHWCFRGIPQHSVVTVAVPDARYPGIQRFFRNGFETMLAVLQPSLILVYGRLPFTCDLAVEHEPDVVALRRRVGGQRAPCLVDEVCCGRAR
jgi:hypothetical protein